MQNNSRAKAGTTFLIAMAAIFCGLLGIWPGQSEADDRSLFQATNAKPYVFFIFDISSSMHRNPQGSRTIASGEDPTARLYLAKRAAYEVIQEVGDSVNYGLATFNRERMTVRRKHWVYKLVNDAPFFSSLTILPKDKPVIFGEPRHRSSSRVGNNTGPGNATSIDDTNKIYKHRFCGDATTTEDKVLDFPKLGHVGDYTSIIYYERRNNEEYRVTFHPLTGGNTMGAMSMDVRVTVEEKTGSCSNENASNSNTYTLRHDVVLNFVRFYTDDLDSTDPFPFADFTDYISYGRSGNDTSGFNMDDYTLTSACSASNLNNPADPDDGRSHRWDGNFDGDLGYGDQLTYDVTLDPLNRGRELARGDMIPWDWEPDVHQLSNREAILTRLAPNLTLGEAIPDFRVARYFEDVPVGGELPLKADFVDHPPIMNARGTPIAGSLTSFKGWYDDWLPRAENTSTGDSALPCRQKFVILLTDGAESCESGSLSDVNSNKRRLPREAAAALYGPGPEPDVRTFVVAFGTTSSELNSLKDIADEGGTGAAVSATDPGRDKNNDGEPDGPGPIAANNKDELVTALLQIFQLVQPEATSISAAAVPSVQADVADKIYLTEFTPLDASSVWPGSLQSFVKPLPFDAEGLPDVNKKCTASVTSSCLAWDAQEVVVDNQVKGSESAPLGFQASQRRIFYSKLQADDGTNQAPVDERVPRQRRFFESVAVPSAPATTPPKAHDLWRGLGIDFTPGTAASEIAAQQLTDDVVDGMLALKTETLPDGRQPEFVIGDFFHSDPLVVNAPSNTTYFLQDLEGDLSVQCEGNGGPTDAKSYRCFALRHANRRKMLFIGSNAGMLHAIDTGNYQLPPSPEFVDLGEFDNGTGREIFAYVPRPVMPTLVDMMVDEPSRHKFTVDGPPVASDVFIDPVHSGVDSMSDAPKAADREWRTVLMGGLRRGGSKTGDRTLSEGEILDPDVVKPDPLDPDADTDIQLTSGYYLLDITQPDLIQDQLLSGGRNDRDGDNKVDVWVPRDVVNTTLPPKCLGGLGMGASEGSAETTDFPSDCGPVAFGTPLWEFLDLMIGGQTALGKVIPPLRLDEDNNGFVDLGFSWSAPVIGRLRVCTGTLCDPSNPVHVSSGDQVDRYVAVFGGGIDPLHPNQRGNYLYMVDIETGRAIYKQRLVYEPSPLGQPVTGSAPGRPVVVPTSDGYIDRIYLGTTAGLLFRLDMRPKDSGGNLVLPRLGAFNLVETAVDPEFPLTAPQPIAKTVQRIEPLPLPGEGEFFRPKALFNVNEDNPHEPRQIFMSPSVFFIADLNELGVAFGTGNRDDLFAEVETSTPGATPRSERFMVFVDDTTGIDLRSSSFTPRTVTSLQRVNGQLFTGQNLLLDRAVGQRGWYIDLSDEERLIGDPLIISGVLFFSTFTPGLPDFVNTGSTVVCEESGLSRVFGTLVSNAEGVLAVSGNPSRSIEVGGLVTAPFAEQSQTKNPAGASGSSTPNELTPALRQLMEELKALFPDNCSFPPGHRLDIKVRNQDTGLTFVVPVPICVVESSFREF